MAKTKPYRKNPSPSHTGLRKYERTFINRKNRRKARENKDDYEGYFEETS
jgi:hypothetical protein